jgi:isoleucyl-tRNA synthetase
LESLEEGTAMTIDGELITAEDVDVRRAPKTEGAALAAHRLVSIEFDPTVTREQQIEGMAREAVRRVQAARKAAKLPFDAMIALELSASGDLRAAIEQFQSRIGDETRARSVTLVDVPAGSYTEQAETDGDALGIGLTVVG